MPTAMHTAGTAVFVTPCIGGGHNSEMYWVGGSNIYPSQDKITFRTRGLMTSAALPSSQRTARKSSCTRIKFPRKNPI